MDIVGSLVQTNIDHWSDDEEMDILYSIDRREKVKKFFARNPHVTENALWKLLSAFPIFNSLTIYASLMVPKFGLLKTKLRGELKSKNEETNLELYEKKISLQIDNSIKIRNCIHCGREFSLQNNPSGECKHNGEWHQYYSDCSVKCGYGLKFNIGKAHWSCCYNVYYDSGCRKSKFHSE